MVGVVTVPGATAPAPGSTDDATLKGGAVAPPAEELLPAPQENTALEDFLLGAPRASAPADAVDAMPKAPAIAALQAKAPRGPVDRALSRTSSLSRSSPGCMQGRPPSGSGTWGGEAAGVAHGPQRCTPVQLQPSRHDLKAIKERQREARQR